MPKITAALIGAYDKVLDSTVWVNESRQIISLADVLNDGPDGRMWHELSRMDAIGAYVSLQIQLDNFDIRAEELETIKIIEAVQKMVMARAKQIMDGGYGE